MRVVTPRRLKEFAAKHPQAKIPLLNWYQTIKGASWQNVVDVKQNVPYVDYVGNNRFVFNIKGNDYRLIAIIIFASQKVYIRFIGTHAEYDKIDARTI